jgi:hypothetical protein
MSLYHLHLLAGLAIFIGVVLFAGIVAAINVNSPARASALLLTAVFVALWLTGCNCNGGLLNKSDEQCGQMSPLHVMCEADGWQWEPVDGVCTQPDMHGAIDPNGVWHVPDPVDPDKAGSWDQENLKRDDNTCRTMVFIAPGGNLRQCP